MDSITRSNRITFMEHFSRLGGFVRFCSFSSQRTDLYCQIILIPCRSMFYFTIYGINVSFIFYLLAEIVRQLFYLSLSLSPSILCVGIETTDDSYDGLIYCHSYGVYKLKYGIFHFVCCQMHKIPFHQTNGMHPSVWKVFSSVALHLLHSAPIHSLFRLCLCFPICYVFSFKRMSESGKKEEK